MFGLVLVILTILSLIAASILAKQSRQEREESETGQGRERSSTSPAQWPAWVGAVVAVIAWVGVARFAYLAAFPLGSSMYGMENQAMSWNARAQLIGFPGFGVAAVAFVVLIILAVGCSVFAFRRFRVVSAHQNSLLPDVGSRTAQGSSPSADPQRGDSQEPDTAENGDTEGEGEVSGGDVGKQ